MSFTERFNQITYSDADSFYGDTTGRIELKGYQDDLKLLTSFDSTINADYAYGTTTATSGDTVLIENFGVFGQHLLTKNSGYVRYDMTNFEGLTSIGSVKFRLKPNFSSVPAMDTELISFYNGSDSVNRISLIHDTSSNIILNMYDDAGDTQVNATLGAFTGYDNDWHAFEFSWNESLAQLFIDGVQIGLTVTGFTRGDSCYLFVQGSGDSSDTYGFDELQVYNTYQNNSAYTVSSDALQKYDDTDPYIDINFGTGFTEAEVTDMNITSHAETHYVVKIGASWYYYLAGSWRTSDGSYSQSNTPSIMETKFADLTFNEEAELIIRVYFHSDGQELIWLDEIEIVVETGAASTAAITGSIAITTLDLTSLYNVVITTNSGSGEVNLAAGAGDTSAVTLAEIKAAIDAAEVPGLAEASDDGSGHLVLQSASTGTTATIEIDNGTTSDALSLVWGYEADDTGEAATGTTVDYTELFRYIRGKLGEPQIPAEITDEQLEDCLSDAIYQYNRRKNFEEEVLYTTLDGDAHDGYTIPAIIGGSDNIIEIIMSPRYPFSYYAGRTDLISNLYVQSLFKKYGSGFSSMLTDYYVTITTEEDINVILGTQVKWEIIGGKLKIWPAPTNMNIAIKYRGTLSAEEIVSNYWIRKLVLAESKIVLGNIRSTFKSGIPGGTEMMQLNGEDLKQEGTTERQEILAELVKNQEPLFLSFF